MKHILPERVKERDGVQKAANRHPEAIGEGHEGERDDEAGNKGGDEDDQGFGGEEIKEKPSGLHVRVCCLWVTIWRDLPHDEIEERRSGWVKVREPVRDDGEKEGDAK